MEIPNNIKFRLFLSNDGKVNRKFYWFEMNHEDFYWGSSYKGARNKIPESDIKDNKITISVPEDFDKLPKLSGKYSYHESGQTHFKMLLEDKTDLRIDKSKWITKDKIQKPTRFFAVISRALGNYNKYSNKKNKQNEYSTLLNFEGASLSTRIYFEFYLTPEGTFNFPDDFEIAYLGDNDKLNKYETHSLSKDLILLVRFAILNSFDWHDDKEICFIPNEIRK